MDGQVISVAWESIVAIVAGTGVVTAGLTALAGWLVVRFTKPLDSYTEEFAKQVARHQNLEKLEEETRRITDAAERIKSELSYENWDRQTRWAAKRDLYVQIAQSLGDLRRVYITMKRLERLRLTNLNYGPELDTRRRDGLRAMEDGILNLQRATDTAPLMVPDAPLKPLREFKPKEIRFEPQDWEADFEYNITSTQRALYHFQTAARADLGFDPMEWEPTIVTAESRAFTRNHEGGIAAEQRDPQTEP